MRHILIAVLDPAQRGADNKVFSYLQQLEQWMLAPDTQLLVQRLPCVFKHSLLVMEQLINQYQPSQLLLVAQQATLTPCCSAIAAPCPPPSATGH